MILWIDELGKPHVVDTLDSSMIRAINDGVIDVYRFVLATNSAIEGTGTYQQYNGVDWITVE